MEKNAKWYVYIKPNETKMLKSLEYRMNIKIMNIIPGMKK